MKIYVNFWLLHLAKTADSRLQLSCNKHVPKYLIRRISKKGIVMKKLLLTLVTLSTCILSGCAQNIPNIQDVDYPEFEYPIRKDAFVIVLQPVPDNSGDYTMTICNKESHCRQTSMLETEIRYIGLFLEDIKPVLSVELNRKLTKDEWDERQSSFRDMYADYMNMYDNTIGELKAVTPAEVKVNVTGIRSQQ